MCRRLGAITFLKDKESLKGVDPDFRKLVEFFHQIPFCATFGVSCAGHFWEKETENFFWPRPTGDLTIIVLPSCHHIQQLLKVISATIRNYTDTSFKEIKHIFGPPKESPLEIWEIKIGDNGCLIGLKNYSYGWYLGGWLPIETNRIFYRKAKKRYKEIKNFWRDLERKVADFCKEQGFKKFDLEKRIKELTDH